jgi:hypothetical protein
MEVREREREKKKKRERVCLCDCAAVPCAQRLACIRVSCFAVPSFLWLCVPIAAPDAEVQVLIPVFALGRAQELCILLDTYWERMGLTYPIYFSAGPSLYR